jgi:hypothetical protein
VPALTVGQALRFLPPTHIRHELHPRRNVGSEKLVLTRDQLESDPGNYFASHFLRGFGEAATGPCELIVHKEYHILKLIQAHLRGYDILPLSDKVIPYYMTKETMISNLLKEAELYGLKLLHQRIRNCYQSIKTTPLQEKKYKFAVSNSPNDKSDLTVI